MPELMPFQVEGVEFLKNRKHALLADEPGLGKTIQAIAAINVLKARKVVVVCPAIVKLNWEKEFKKWLTEPLVTQVLSGRKDKIAARTDVVILNYDLLISPTISAQLLQRTFAVGVFDESHYMKNLSAKRTKAVLFKGGLASRCVYKWCLTGTPILNRPIELYPVLRSLAPAILKPYDSYERFARRFCDGWWDGFQIVAKGASNTDDLSIRLNSGFMLRRMKKDHLHELPDKQYQMVAIPADPKVKALVKKEFTFHKDDAKFVAVAEGGPELAVLRHELALSKVDTCLEHIQDVLNGGVEKVVVFAYHTDVIKRLEDGLANFAPVVIQGKTLGPARSANIDTFQKNPLCRVFIGQIQAAGVGITLTAASHVVFVETSWVPGEIDQATDRCHRIGQKDSVLVQFMVIQDSLEERIVRTIIDKRETIAKIVEDKDEIARMFL